MCCYHTFIKVLPVGYGKKSDYGFLCRAEYGRLLRRAGNKLSRRRRVKRISKAAAWAKLTRHGTDGEPGLATFRGPTGRRTGAGPGAGPPVGGRLRTATCGGPGAGGGVTAPAETGGGAKGGGDDLHGGV